MYVRLCLQSLFCLGLSLALAGCTFNYLDAGMAELKGKPVKTAFNYLGYPDSKNNFEGTDVYVWERSFQTTTMKPVTTTTHGNAFTPYGGLTSYQGTSTSYVPDVSSSSCVIKIAAEKGIIINGSYEGDFEGCYEYGEALKPLYDEQEARIEADEQKAKETNTETTKGKK